MVVSNRGKQAVIAILETGDFFDKGCLSGQLVRMSSAAAMCESSVGRLEKAASIAVIHIEPAFSELLRLANFGKEGKPEAVIPKMSRETLAEIMGTTRSSVSFFMNRFHKMGFIGDKNGLEVHCSLLNVLLLD